MTRPNFELQPPVEPEKTNDERFLEHLREKDALKKKARREREEKEEEMRRKAVERAKVIWVKVHELVTYKLVVIFDLHAYPASGFIGEW